MSLIPFVKRLQPFLPISSRVQWGSHSLRHAWEWTLLDTFDSYSAKYEFPQREEKVCQGLRQAKMVEVQRTSARGMAITAKKPSLDVATL